MNRKQVDRHFLKTHFTIAGFWLVATVITAFWMRDMKSLLTTFIVFITLTLWNLVRCLKLRNAAEARKWNDE